MNFDALAHHSISPFPQHPISSFFRCWCSRCIPGREPGGVGAEPTHLTTFRLRGQTAESSACRAEDNGGSTRLRRHFLREGCWLPVEFHTLGHVRSIRAPAPNCLSITRTRTIPRADMAKSSSRVAANHVLPGASPGSASTFTIVLVVVLVFVLVYLRRQRIESDSPRWYRGKDGARPSGGSTLRHWCQQRAWLSSKQRGRVQVSHAAPILD